MSTSIKIFSNQTTLGLEQDVNQWMHKSNGIKITNILYAPREQESNIVIVFEPATVAATKQKINNES